MGCFFAILIAMCQLLALAGQSNAEVNRWSLGGERNESWYDWTTVNVMVDTVAAPGSMQPFELDPEENFLTRLGPWGRWLEPRDLDWRPGNPRIWHGNIPRHLTRDWDPRILVDDDRNSGKILKLYWINPTEYFTIDLGVPVPIEQFRFYPPDGFDFYPPDGFDFYPPDGFDFYPPDGFDELSGEPFRPSYALRNYHFSVGNDVAAANRETSTNFTSLSTPIAQIENNFDYGIIVDFPLQYLRLFRFRPMSTDLNASRPQIQRYGLGEMELYGRGFVPEATWESRPIDMGRMVNVGRVQFFMSRWRREGDESVPAPQASATVEVQLKSGIDETPTSYFTYDQMGRLVETNQEDFAANLKTRQWPWHPAGVGWRGPVVEDTENWSFWTASLQRSGDRPRLPRSRYVKLRVRLKTESLWEFARLDSLVMESSPLLAERVKGEVAAAGDLLPEGNMAQVPAGELTEFVYDMGGEFFEGQSGFDAVRVSTSPGGGFLALEMGEPLAEAEPDSVVADDRGFAVYLPRRIGLDGDQRLRLRLQTTIYDAADVVAAEVFDRLGELLPQAVEPGDVSGDIGTDQLRVLAVTSSLGNVLGELNAGRRVLTPQGDGVNDQLQIEYRLFRVRSARVEVDALSLDGRRRRTLFAGVQSAGQHLQTWDGRDDSGELVPPGIYVLRVVVEADDGNFRRLQTLAVAY